MTDYIVFHRRTNGQTSERPYEARVPRWIYGSLTLFTATSSLLFWWMATALKPSPVVAAFGIGVAAIMAGGCVFSIWSMVNGGEVNFRIDALGISGRDDHFRKRHVPWEAIFLVAVTTVRDARNIPTRRLYVIDDRGSELLVIMLASRTDTDYRALIDYLYSVMNEDEKPRWHPQSSG